jgi:hypothetical protein
MRLLAAQCLISINPGRRRWTVPGPLRALAHRALFNGDVRAVVRALPDQFAIAIHPARCGAAKPDPVARLRRDSGATAEAVTKAQIDQYKPIAEPTPASHC